MGGVLNLLADKIVKRRMYPALAVWQARPYTQQWHRFQDHWPCTIPLRFQEYADQHHCAYRASDQLSALSHPAFYGIGLGFFDFQIDYIELLPRPVYQALRRGDLRLLFYYHEGDNPWNIRARLDQLCAAHKLGPEHYVFVSANSAANDIGNFVEFVDFELWYYQRNIDQAALPIYLGERSRDFTILNRLHKSWRSLIMTDLWRTGLLRNSYWSYCEPVQPESYHDCPIEIDSLQGLRQHCAEFASETPRFCDDQDQTARNDHSQTLPYLYQDSWFNIVIETHFDVDGSGGVFLTEKTFKPIKHGQPFFIAGAAGSLDKLRELGYRTFDDVLDNSYDLEKDSTRRWIKLLDSIQQARSRDLADLFQRCVPDLTHNQQNFMRSKYDRLNRLTEKIHQCLK
jgi:hypothetical protein